VVEDEFLVALDVAATLRNAGCEVVEICTSEEAAERTIAHQALDAAVLDVSLRGKMAFAIADRLVEADVPFIWVSGYSREVLPEQHRQRPLVGKPFQSGTLVAELKKATSSRF
jgi:CheY-like chemotaxis protein